MLNSTKEQLLDSLRHKQLHIDCVKIDLVRASDGKSFSGPGYIRQKKDRHFQIKVYVGAKLDFKEYFDSWASATPGVFCKAEEFFELTAIDDDGQTWRAQRIIDPKLNGHGEVDGHVVIADCQEIELVEARDRDEKAEWVTLRSFDQAEFPPNARTEENLTVGKSRSSQNGRWNAAEITSNSLNFCFEDDEGLFVTVWADTLPPLLAARVSEAITFALGTITKWDRVELSSGDKQITYFRNHDRAKKQPMPWPPYKIEVRDQTGSTWRIFDLYLSYALRDDSGQARELARGVWGIAQTRSSTSEGQALAVVVAVEAILDQFFSSVGKPDAAHIANVDELIAHLSAWSGDKKLIARALGAITPLRRARADDRLVALVGAGAVGDAQRQAWKKLRNAVAHGDWHIFDGKHQELLDQTLKVTVLFNQLVFHVIGYAGKQSDYGARGWPDVDYPPSVPKPSEENTPTPTGQKLIA